jgi:hypothetical protein
MELLRISGVSQSVSVVVILVCASESTPLLYGGGTATVCTVKPVFAGQSRLVLSSSASSQHLSFVFELSGQATAVVTFCNEEYDDIHCIYGYCDGNARETVEVHQQRFRKYRLTDRRVFSNVRRNLRELVHPPNQDINGHYDAM